MHQYSGVDKILNKENEQSNIFTNNNLFIEANSNEMQFKEYSFCN